MNALEVWSRAERACQRRAAKWLSRRPFTVPPGRAIVSFTFDDFPRSALVHGGGILESFRLAGTYYVSLGLAGKITPTGQMFELEDLDPLLELGHELGCHTFDHCPAWETDPAVFASEVARNAAALRELVPTAALRSLSYPISYPRPETKRRVSAQFDCCRGGGQTFNHELIDLNYVSAYFLEQARGRIDEVARVIRENQRAGGWLIFATHDVWEHPTPYGCTPEFFRDVVRHVLASGAEVLPVSEAMKTLHARAGSSVA